MSNFGGVYFGGPNTFSGVWMSKQVMVLHSSRQTFIATKPTFGNLFQMVAGWNFPQKNERTIQVFLIQLTC